MEDELKEWQFCAECGSEKGERYLGTDKKWRCKKCYWEKNDKNTSS